MKNVELLFDQACAVGESPIWVAETGHLWWVDIVASKVHRLHTASGAHRAWSMPEMVGCIAPIKSHDAGALSDIATGGHWIAALETCIVRVSFPENGDAGVISQVVLTHQAQNMRCNDGRCDRQGRFLVSTMYKDMVAAKPVGELLTLDDRGVSRHFGQPLIVGNGLAFSPSGATMFIADSHPSVQTVWQCDYDTETGMPTNPRVFVDFNSLNGRPDGAAIDVDGCYWICANDGAAVYRFTPTGKLDKCIPVPVKKPSMCAFGGPNRDTLFIASIRPVGVDISDQPLAGCMFAVQTTTQGIAEPAFCF